MAKNDECASRARAVSIYFAVRSTPLRAMRKCVRACVHRQRERRREREKIKREKGDREGERGWCAAGAKAKYAAAPASRSIMRRVTHASLLHCEPCYASARQGARRIYGGISAVIERYAPSSRYLFLPVGAGAPRRSASARYGRPRSVRSLLRRSRIYEQLPKPRELASTCSENIESQQSGPRKSIHYL